MRRWRRPGTLPVRVLLGTALAMLASCTSPTQAGGPSPTSSPSSTQSAASASPQVSTSATVTATPRPSATPDRCAALVESMSLRERVGQLLMVGISSAGPTTADADILASTRAGSVLLLGNSTASLTTIADVTARARRAARPPKGVQTLLAVDQEGGLVQRLKGAGFDPIPAAADQAAYDNRALAAKANRWGRQLKRAGIDADLAPVADVVPESARSRNQPIAQLRRGYGSDPQRVGTKVRAFVAGMNEANVATAVKHFPGLGLVEGNTDFESHVVDGVTRRHDRMLAGFTRGVHAGADMVMVSSATYRKIDANRRATFSPAVLRTMIRGDLQFSGVIISDDLAAQAMHDLSPANRLLRFIDAGGDVAIIGDPRIAQTAASALIDEAREDPSLSKLVAASAVRVLKLKDRRGLASC
jgi:beta-N-acetylhexosaminidase